MTEQQFQQEGRRLDGEFAMAQQNQQLRALASRRTGTMPGMSSTLAGYQRMTGPNPAGMASVPAEGVSAAPQASPMRQGPLYGQQSYQNVELAPVNAYGLRRNPGNLEARAPGDSNFVPDQLAPVGPGLIGSMRTDGARVYRTPSGGHRLVGTPTDPEELAALRTSQAEAGEKRRATGLVNRQQREAEASFLRAKRMGLPVQEAVQTALRTGAAAKPAVTGPRPVDQALRGLAQADATPWAMLGVEDFGNMTPQQAVTRLDSSAYRGMSPQVQQQIQNDVENMIAADPDMDPILAEELRGAAKGDKDARKRATTARHKQKFPQYHNPQQPFIPGAGW